MGFTRSLKESSRRANTLLPLAAATICLVTGSWARADLIVNGTDNGTWNNNGTMTYKSNPTDPTSITNAQFFLGTGAPSSGAAGSLTVNSGSLTLTNSTYGAFIGQTTGANTSHLLGGTGNLTINGGTFTWLANGTSEQRAAVGNNWGAGNVTITGGTFNFNTGAGTDTQRGLAFGRQGGSATVALSGTGVFTSATDRFGMGGEFTSAGYVADSGGSTVLTIGQGTPLFELNGLLDTSASSFGINTATAHIDFLSGSGGELAFATGNGTPAGDTAVPQTFFDALVTRGAITIDGLPTTPSAFTYSTNASNEGVYMLAAAPEPASIAVLGGATLLLMKRRQRVSEFAKTSK